MKKKRALDRSPDSLSEGEDVYHKKFHFFNAYIHQIITKAKVDKINKIILYLYAQFQYRIFLPNPNGQGCPPL